MLVISPPPPSPSTPWNFCNFPTWLGTPGNNISVKNAIVQYFYGKDNCFCDKEKTVSNNLNFAVYRYFLVKCLQMQFKGVNNEERLKCLRSAVFGMRMLNSWLHRSCDSLARSVFLRARFCQPFYYFELF